MNSTRSSVALGLGLAALTPGALAQAVGPLNASPASVQVPATAIFLEQGTAGSSISATVGARHGDFAFTLGFRSAETSADGPGDLLTTAGGLVDNGRVSISLFWSRFRTDRSLQALQHRLCALRGLTGPGVPCGTHEFNTDARFTAADRAELARYDETAGRLSAFGGGPTILLARASVTSTSIEYFDERMGTTQSQSRPSYDVRVGVGRYLSDSGLLAASMGYTNSVRRPGKQMICQEHLVNGMAAMPPQLECREQYLSGLRGSQTLDLRVEWRQYLSETFAWNPSLTLPWAARDDDATTPTDENVLRIDHVDLESPVYARLGTELQLHVGVRPAMTIWTESHSTGPVDLSLSVFLGGSFGLLPL